MEQPLLPITLPDREGNLEDIVCGFNNLEGYFSAEYLQNAPYFGCTVGRYASELNRVHLN